VVTAAAAAFGSTSVRKSSENQQHAHGNLIRTFIPIWPGCGGFFALNIRCCATLIVFGFHESP
jgi:hypothetical protein